MSAHRLKLNGLVNELWAELRGLAVALALLAGCAVFCPTTPAGAEFLWLLMYVPTTSQQHTQPDQARGPGESRGPEQSVHLSAGPPLRLPLGARRGSPQ